MNLNILKQFNKLLYQINYDIDVSTDIIENRKNLFRLKSIENSIEIIKKFNKNLIIKENLKELSKLEGIGSGTIKRIKEIINTGCLKEIKVDNANIKYLKELTKVYGIGNKIALKLINNNDIKNVKELKIAIKNNKIKVPRAILLGLKYYGKYKEHIPRLESKMHNKLLKKIAKSIDKNLIIKLGGSYRRKLPFSGDIDCVLTCKDKCNKNKNYLKLFIDKLKEKKYIVDELTTSYNNKFLGFCKLMKYIRRIDIVYVPYSSYYTALFYFTGNKKFNQNIRKYAKDKEYKLNEHGLFKNNKKIDIKSEKDIFDELKIKFVKPEFREV
jgi:DNA polymerase/3'-5' exonuclease PolX